MPTPFRLVALALLAAAPLAAQSVPRQTLTSPQLQLPESFDQVAGLRELQDGRLLIADRAAKTLWLVDVARGTQQRVGREGSGPGEYQLPAALVPLPGDTTLLVDPLQQRLLQILPSGAVGVQLQLPESIGLLSGVKGTDRMGRLYASGSPLRFGPTAAGAMPAPGLRADTIPILRWARTGTSLDTVAMVQGALRDLRINRTGGNMSVMMRQQPYSAQDDWHVAPDGRVAVVRHQPYRVEWIGATTVVGPAVAWQPVKVTQADKDLIEAAQRNPANRLSVSRGGPPPAGVRPPSAPAGATTYPATKPPFVERTAIASPKGELWVQRSVASGAPTVYDVFDGQAKLVRQVQLPARARVVGFGAAGVYIARMDEDDLQWVGRYAY